MRQLKRKDVCGWDQKRKKISCIVIDFISDRHPFCFFLKFFFFKKCKWHDCNTQAHTAVTFFFLIYFFQKMQVGDTRVTYRQDHLKSQTIPLDTHTHVSWLKKGAHTQ